MCRSILSLLFLAIVVTAGCGKAKPQGTTETPKIDVAPLKPTSTVEQPKPTTHDATVTKDEVFVSKDKLNQGLLIVTAAEGSAEAAFQQTLVAFQNGRLDVAFDQLPPSYQTDIIQIVHSFGEKMDPEIWSKGFALVTKFATVMKAKKSLILEFDAIKRLPQLESIKPHWDDIASAIVDATTSEYTNIENVKTCDVRQMLVSAGGLLTRMPLPKFGDVTVTTLTSNSDAATLSYRESKEGELKQVEFVKVEGKWLPKSITTGWSAGIDSLKERLSTLPDRVATIKPVVVQQFDSFGESLDKIQKAKTSEEFSAGFIPLIFTVRLGSQIVQQAMLESASASRSANAIRIEINRELTDDEQTKLKDAIVSTFDSLTLDYEMLANDGKTRCRFTPITEPETLVDVLRKHYEGADIRFAAESKTIQVELK